jgi:hypothetical protein
VETVEMVEMVEKIQLISLLTKAETNLNVLKVKIAKNPVTLNTRDSIKTVAKTNSKEPTIQLNSNTTTISELE